MASKKDVSEQQNEVHRRVLAKLLKEEGNKYCVDCRQRNPTWASVNLGVFMCLSCSGIHRSLGVHITQVRSCTLDTWLPKQVEYMSAMGNIKGNIYWESNLPGDFRRPSGTGTGPTPELEKFIREKYIDRRYAAKDAQPPTIDNYLTNPYGKTETVKATTPVAAPAAQPAVAAVAPPTSSLLDVDDSPPAAAATTAATPADDPFSSFMSAPPPAATPNAGGDWGDFESSASVAAPSKAAQSPPSAPAADPFGAFVSSTLSTQLENVHVTSTPHAQSQPKKETAPKKTADDILKLFNEGSGNKSDPYGDNLFGAPIQNAPLPALGAPPTYPGMQGPQHGMPGMQGPQHGMPGMGMQHGMPGMPGMPGMGVQGMGMGGMPHMGGMGMQQGYGQVPAGMQMGMQPGMGMGMHPGMQPGMHMGMQPGMGMPGMGMQPGMGMAMPGMPGQYGMHPQPAMGMMPHPAGGANGMAPGNVHMAGMQYRM